MWATLDISRWGLRLACPSCSIPSDRAALFIIRTAHLARGTLKIGLNTAHSQARSQGPAGSAPPRLCSMLRISFDLSFDYKASNQLIVENKNRNIIPPRLN